MFAYQRLIDDGFTRIDVQDQFHEEAYGYPCFWLEMKLSKKRQLVWNPTDQAMKLIIHDCDIVKDTVPITSEGQYTLLKLTFCK